jgi:hypothetical protein
MHLILTFKLDSIIFFYIENYFTIVIILINIFNIRTLNIQHIF